MDAKGLILKYRLDKTSNFPYDKFLEDFNGEFISQLQQMHGYERMAAFRFCINTMRALFDTLDKVTPEGMPKFIWDKFYRITVCQERIKVKGYDYKKIEERRLQYRKKHG